MEVRAPVYACEVCGTKFPWVPGVLNSTKGSWPDRVYKAKCPFCNNYSNNKEAKSNDSETPERTQ